MPELSESAQRTRTAINWFVGVLLGLVALQLVLAFVPVPLWLIKPADVVVTFVEIAAPIFGMYQASKADWSPKAAFLVLIVGLALHIGLQALASRMVSPLSAAILVNLSQSGLLTWCLAVGALLATLLKEKNLVLPVAIFLAAFDFFLVLTPLGFTQAILKANPKILSQVGYHVNQVSTQPTSGHAVPFAHIGPADFLFLGMFFIALHRFQMRSRETLIAIVPTLVAYMAVVLLFGSAHIGRFALGALPALLPIGTVVVLVNLREFKMTGEEKISTVVVALIGVGLVAFGLTRKQTESQAGPSQQGSAPGPQGQEGSPAPTAPSRRP